MIGQSSPTDPTVAFAGRIDEMARRIAELERVASGGYLTATTANLESLTSDVNTRGKRVGKMVWNTTTHRPVYAAGSAAGDIWYDTVGATAHTPV